MEVRNISLAGALQSGGYEQREHDVAGGPVSAPLHAISADSGLAPEREAMLIAQARTGEQEAFAQLVQAHQRQVYALAYRMLRDQEEASEATQDVFLAAWQGLRGFRAEARFSTWLYRIAYRHCLKVAESCKRDSVARAELVAESARAQSAQRLTSDRYAQDAARETQELVRAEIAGLPPKYRMALVLRHLQELSYEEMAEVMRVPIGTVKTQLFRARALLKDRLEGLSADLDRARNEGLARADELRAGLEASLRSVWEHGRKPLRGGSEL
ncbi:MAG TPA: sigma-70 family RNA polymerase sigma factor [Ktedonobacterales bacterium]|nr:sigma-70 family RNA polymerase sigma factor [Ktedonobacterales bacterium]